MMAEGRGRGPRETVLITGASSGIGQEFARLFARGRTDLVLVARRRDRLEHLADELTLQHRIEAAVITADLAEPDAPARIQGEIEVRGLTVDVLVNNAGFGARGRFADLDGQRQLDMIAVNVKALVELTRRFLPAMTLRRRGGILNVGSQAGFIPGPEMAVYYATKAFVLSFTEALAEELRGTGVRVSVLAPGPVATEFAQAAGMTSSRLFELRAADAAAIARAGYDGFRRGRVIVIPEITGRLGVGAVRLMPRSVVRRLIHAVHR
jgi:short-subunit dehydrogenase